MAMDWFRFYSETIRDPKIRRVARKTGKPTVHVIGVWSVLLSMASESQQRGTLLLGNAPVTLDDIEDITDCNVSETLQEMVEIGLLALADEVYSIPAWGKRQYESDNSTPRVQKHRQNKKQSETLQERFRNAPETDAETDAETDGRVTKSDGVLHDVTLSPTYPPGFEAFETNFRLNLLTAVKERDPQQGLAGGFSLSDASKAMLVQVQGGGTLLTAKSIDWALDQWEAAKPTEKFRVQDKGCVNWLLTVISNSYKPNHVNGTGKATTDPDNRPRVKAPPAAEVAAADARQAEYERQVAEQLARAGKLL